MSQDPLHLLCVEPRFPGRLGALADWLVRHRGYNCRFYCHQFDAREFWPESVGQGIELVQFGVGGVAREASVPWTKGLERGLCYAYGAWEVLEGRRPRPIDLVLGRSAGLGSTLFAPVAYPRAPMVNLFDGYLHPASNDLADEDAPALPAEFRLWRRSANAMDLLDLENGIHPWTTSRWQRDLYPPEYQPDFHVQPDGVPTRNLPRSNRDGRRVVLGRTLTEGTRLVTFVARTLDRLRGFDRFLGLANRLMRERSDVICVAIGGGIVDRMLDVRYYGQDFGARALADQTPVDPDRFWTPGRVPPIALAELLAASDLHVVASRPHAVSRSTIAALAAGAVVLAWDSAPIREFLNDGRDALLVPPDDPDRQLETALEALDDPAEHRPLGEAAASLVRERFSHEVTMPALAEWFDRICNSGGKPLVAGNTSRQA